MTSRADAKPWGSLVWDGKCGLVMRMPLTAWTTNVQVAGGFVAPCPLKLVHFKYAVITPSTQASSFLSMGKGADVDYFVNEFDLNAIAAGSYTLPMDHAAVLIRDVEEGDYVFFNLADAGDSADGNIAATAVFEPR